MKSLWKLLWILLLMGVAGCGIQDTVQAELSQVEPSSTPDGYVASPVNQPSTQTPLLEATQQALPPLPTPSPTPTRYIVKLNPNAN